jgi:hypothetical protein
MFIYDVNFKYVTLDIFIHSSDDKTQWTLNALEDLYSHICMYWRRPKTVIYKIPEIMFQFQDKPGNHACGYCGLRFVKEDNH